MTFSHSPGPGVTLSGSPAVGGSNTQVQYNNAGTLAGAAGVTTDGTTLTVSGSSASAMLRVTQTGAGNALLVEDSANPDATPFVVTADGTAIAGHTTNLSAGLSYNFQSAGTSALAGYSAARYSANVGAPVIALGKSRNTTVAVGAIVQSGDSLGIFDFRGDDGAAFITAAQIAGVVDGTPGLNDMPGRLTFSTTADGAASATERMRITNGGLVGIGTTPTTAILDVQSTTRGVRFPNMTTVQKNAIATPQAGTMVFDTTLAKLCFYTGAAWETITSL